MKVKYYWHETNDWAKLYRKVGDEPAEYWSVTDKRWVTSSGRDANRPDALDGHPFRKITTTEAKRRATEIGGVL